MQHTRALGMKFLMILVVLGITLGLIGNATFGQVLAAAIVLTIVAYLVGDLLILPATQNWIAVAADAGIAWAVLRIVVPHAARGTPLLLSVLALAAGEYFFHRSLKEAAVRNKA